MRYDYHIPFIDRENEQKILKREFRRRGFSLAIVYGRRRIGKTRLLRELLLSGERGVYYVAAELSYRQICREFVRAVSDQLGVHLRSGDLVEALEELGGMGGIVVVLDEFQYIVDADPTLPSRLQRAVDSSLSRSGLKLVLSGSAVSFFEKKLLGYRSPLYGRRTSTVRLRPLRFPNALGFLSGFSLDDAVRVYSVLGGTPAYLRYAYGLRSVEGVLRRVMEPGNPLIDEVDGLLRQELREPRRYMALLKAFAEGRVNPYEAAMSAGIDPRTIHRYIEVLEELDIIRIRRPLGFKRGARVFFKDNYFRFWFTYILPLKHMIELGMSGEAVKTVLTGLDRYTSKVFENVVEETLPELYRLGWLPTKPVEHGPWWHKDVEIDLVVRDPGRSATFIEVKWRDVNIDEAIDVVEGLRSKAVKTGLQEDENHYFVVARSVSGVKEPVTVLEPRGYAVSFMKLSRYLAGSVYG